MAIDLSEWELAALCNPASFYEAIVSAKGYMPKLAVVAGDCEFLVTNFAANGCIVCGTVVHRTREAHVVMLSNEDMTELRERLAGVQVELNSAVLTKCITGRRF
jgi:hypothetical protein